MAEIIPAVMPKNYEDLKNKVALVRGIAPVVQVDIMDGKFVRYFGWPFLAKPTEGEPYELDAYAYNILEEREGLPFWEDIDYELDLMVSRAHDNFDLFLKLGAKRIIFHIEAEGETEELREFIEGIDLYVREHVQIGVAINITTPVSSLSSLMSVIDFVQFMGIEHIGRQGEPFDERALDQIRSLRKDYPEATISVDGGVNLDTAPLLIEAGADRLVAGSAIFQSFDIRESIKELKNL